MAANRQKARNVIILVDMDGVLADFEGYFLTKFKECYPEKPFVPLEERNTFYLSKQYNDDDKLTTSILCAPGFYRNLPPIEGAIEAVKEMSTMDGVEVFICTSPMLKIYEYCAVEKYAWVEQHLGKSWLQRMVLSPDKTIVKGDLLIDDKHFISGAEKCPTWEHVLFTACHNRHVPLKGRKRLDSWFPHKVWMDMIEDVKDEVRRKGMVNSH